MRYYNVRIKRYDEDHFSITTYNYGNRIDYTSLIEETKQLEVSDIEGWDEWEYTPTLFDRVCDVKRSITVSTNRAKNMIYDYARSNDFEWFVTMTFNPEKVDSFDYSACSRKLSDWIKNVRRRYSPDIRYLFVPELHKSGRYHFHGLLGEIGTLPLVDSGKRDHDQVIYNIDNYKLGFTTATKILDKQRTATYIGKYITKELSGHIRGKKRYWNSKNLMTPKIENLTYDELLDMGIDQDFLENNSMYSKTVEYDVNGYNRKVSYYEFQREKEG